MLLYIANLPFDIRLARLRQLIHDQCRIDDVILDNLVNNNGGKRVTVGLVDQEQASLVMAKINGYFLDGRKLQVEHVQKKAAPPQPQPMMKPFNQAPQPTLNNYSMMLQQPANYNMNTLLNAMPYYMAQQNFGNVKQPTSQTVPFPSFNKDIAGNWYAMNYGNQQYGLSTAQSVQNAGMGNPQKRSHDQSFDIPEKRPRGDGQFGSYSVEEIDDRDRSHDRSHTSRDRDRYDRNDGRDRYDDSRDKSYTSRDDRYNNDDYNRRDERHRRNDRYDSPDHRNRRDERNNRDRYDYDDRQDNRDDRQNSRDDRRNSRNERHDRGDNRNDNTGRSYDSDAERSFDSERSTFDNNKKSGRVVVWEKNPYKLDRRPNVGNNPPKPLIPQADNPQENFNYQQNFNLPQPIFNKLLHLSGNIPFNNQQNFPQSSNNPQKNYNNQQNFPQSSNKPQQNFNKQQKSNNAGKKTLTRNEARTMQYKALNEIVRDLLGRFKVPQEAYQNIRRLCDSRLKSIMEEHNCTSIGQFFKHYSKEYPYENDQELVEALREFGITDSSQALPRKPGIESARQRQRKAQASKQASSQPPPPARKGPQNAPPRPRLPQPSASSLLGPIPNIMPKISQPGLRFPQASATSLLGPIPNMPKISQPAIVPQRVPPLKPVPAAEKLPKYPNANKNVYRELKKQTQLEAKEDFSYQVDKKYIPTLEFELRKMRELAIKACMDKSNEKIEKVRQEIVNYGIDKVIKAIRMHITKRLSNNFVGSVRMNFKYKGPKKAELETFLKDYNVVSLKKSERGKFYVATCNSSDGYDRLLEEGAAMVDNVVLTIKPLNILGKPDKKEMLTKFQNNVNNMALKFQSKMIGQASGQFTGQVQAQVSQEPVKEQMNEEVTDLVEDLQDLDQSQLDDVEIIYKEDEVIEIKHDCDFSEDVIEIKDFNQPEAQLPQSEAESDNNQNSKQESKAKNIEKESQEIEISEQELQNFEEEPHNSGQESQNSGQESQNLAQESQNSEQDLQILEEIDELKSAVISNIDDEDLEDF